jgi:23S rRNA pseudouridine2605 synthase
LRINRFLASAGLGARRKCEVLVREGRIEVNGKTVETLGFQVDPENDEVCCDGERVRLPHSSVHLVMNKPSGVVVSANDDQGRRTVYDLLPPNLRGRVRAVGRLDRASEGMLLFTNDGQLAHGLMHPSREVEKTYVAWVTPPPKLDAIRALRAGVPLGRGERSGEAKVRSLGTKKETARIRVTLREGKNREVRRMFRAVGCRVLALRRVQIDGVVMGEVRMGGHRRLSSGEIEALRRAVGRKPRRKAADE